MKTRATVTIRYTGGYKEVYDMTENQVARLYPFLPDTVEVYSESDTDYGWEKK